MHRFPTHPKTLETDVSPRLHVHGFTFIDPSPLSTILKQPSSHVVTGGIIINYLRSGSEVQLKVIRERKNEVEINKQDWLTISAGLLIRLNGSFILSE